MPTPGVAGTLHEVTVHMRQQLQEVLNVWHFQCITAVDDMETRCLRALWEAYIESYLPAAGSLLSIERISAAQVGATLGPIYELFPSEGDVLNGGGAVDTLPTHDSLSIGIHTTRPGRSGRGRKQMAGIPEAATVGSTITTAHAYWLAVQAFIADLDAKFIPTGEPIGDNIVVLGVIAKTLKPHVPPAVPKAPWPVDTFARALRLSARPVVGTTNSRKVGRGS